MKCDGPTSTATSNARPRSSRYAWAATGPEYISPACGAINATRSPATSRARRSACSRCPSTADASAAAVPGYQLPATAARRTCTFAMLAFDMPAALTREDVAKIAALAQLELDEHELDLFARQLGDILAYANEVQQIDTTGVPPTASVVTRHAADRPDDV